MGRKEGARRGVRAESQKSVLDRQLLEGVLTAEREANPDRRASVRVNSLMGALLEAMPMNASDLGTLLLDMDGNITLDLLPQGSAARIVIVDISAGGLKGASHVPVPDVGKSVVVRIFGERGEAPIPVLAEVAWKKPLPLQDMTAFGLRFVGIHPSHQKRIEDMVRQAAEER